MRPPNRARSPQPLALLLCWLSAGSLVAAPARAQEGDPAPAEATRTEASPPPAEAAAAEVPALANTLRWATASELDNFGFDVYRGDRKEGPFVRLTKTPVLGAGTIDTPSKYSYVDSSIEPGREYFYYVESISMEGVREPFTPVVRVAPKPAPAAPVAPPSTPEEPPAGAPEGSSSSSAVATSTSEPPPR